MKNHRKTHPREREPGNIGGTTIKKRAEVMKMLIKKQSTAINEERGNKKIEAFANDILTECASKGFTVREVDKLCCCLQDKYQTATIEQISQLKFAYSESGTLKAACTKLTPQEIMEQGLVESIHDIFANRHPSEQQK